MHARIWPLALLALSACDGRAPRAPGEPLEVAVSIPPQAYLVERIAGERARVHVLVPAGQDMHTYAPSDQEVTRLMRAQVYFTVGVPFEQGRWFQAVRSAPGLELVDTLAGVERAKGGCTADHDHGQHGHEELDPHTWLDPTLLAAQARAMAEALTRLAPEHQATFAAGLAALLADLETVDREIRELLAAFAGTRFYVYHPAWGYFAARYGLEQVAVEIEGKAPSDRELTELRARMLADGGKVLFLQPQIGGRGAEAVAASLGARVTLLDPLARDVIGVLRTTAREIAEALR